jgi:hypothetical protein
MDSILRKDDAAIFIGCQFGGFIQFLTGNIAHWSVCLHHKRALFLHECNGITHVDAWDSVVVGEGIVLDPENTKVGSRAADGRIETIDGCIRIFFFEPLLTQHPPAILPGDTSAQIGNGHVLAGIKFPEKIWKAVPWSEFKGFAGTVITGMGPLGQYQHAPQQKCSEVGSKGFEVCGARKNTPSELGCRPQINSSR